MEQLVFKFARTFYSPRLDARLFGETYAKILLVVLLSYAFVVNFIVYATVGASVSSDANAAEIIAEAAGSLNQKIYFGLLIAVLPILYLRRQAVFILVKRNLWLIGIVLFCWLSLAWSIAPDVALKRAARLSIIIVIVVALVAALPSKKVWIGVNLFVFGLFILADVAVAPLPLAWDSGGAFVGIHAHKNLAGNFALIGAILFFFALFMAKRWSQVIARAGFLLASLLILLISDSKTSFAVVPMVVPIAFFLEAGLHRGRMALFYGLCLLGVGVAAVGLVFVLVGPSNLVEIAYGDRTLTGRTDIWQFMLGYIRERPLLGYGYGSFWSIGLDGPQRTGDELIQKINQAHNGYIDVIATLGYAGFVVLVGLLVQPFVNLFRAARRHRRLNRNIGPFIAFLFAALVHNSTESSFLLSDHPTWLYTVFAVLYISIYPITIETGRGRPRRRAETVAEQAARRRRLRPPEPEQAPQPA